MLNFTGQTRKRNVNLGRKQQTTKKEILQRAKLERDRRAEEKKQEASAAYIQRQIRKFLSCKKTALLNLTSPKVVHLVPLLGSKLLIYLGTHELLHILNVSKHFLTQFGTALGNWKLLNIYSDCHDVNIANMCINCLNISIPLTDGIIDANIKFISSNEVLRGTSGLHIDVIAPVLSAWKVQFSQNYRRVFEITESQCVQFEEVLHFYEGLVLNDLLPMAELNGSSVLLENMSYLYSKLKHANQRLYNIIRQCVTNVRYEPVNIRMRGYVTEIYQKDFIYSYLDSINIHTNFSSDLLNFIENAPSEAERDSVYVSLLSRENFVENLLNIFSRFQDPEQTYWDDITHYPAFKLLCQLIKVHLWLSTDHELLYNRNRIKLEQLVLFTDGIKDMVFNDMWTKPTNDSFLYTNEALPLLKIIYLRDSRMKFCKSSNGDKEYWTVYNTDFLKTAIYKQIQDYEDYYRSYKDNYDDLYDSDDEDNNDKEINDIMNLKANYLVNMEVKPNNIKQFRKLKILLEAPFYVPFEQRVEMFYTLIELDKRRLNLDDDSSLMMDVLNALGPSLSRRQAVNISRDNVLEDAYSSFNPAGERFKGKLSVTFTNEFGPEAGIDGGGITKEFLTSVTEEGFKNDKYKLFDTNQNYELYPSSEVNATKMKYYYFLGKVLGKCIYDRVLIDIHFTDFLLKKLLNSSNHYISYFDDLQSLDESLYQNLVKLLAMSASDLESLELHFEVDDLSTGKNRVTELIPNGSKTVVTKNNVLQYLVLIADFKLNRSLNKQVAALHRGLSVMIAPHWFEMFNSSELQKLISGEGKDINLEDLKSNTIYGGFSDTSLTIQYFWQILEEFEPQQRLDLLKFVTSVPQAPLKGFGALEPKFGIRNSGPERDRLPTAATCVNLLKLPDYADKELLRQKLLYAINAGAGFDLS